MNKSLASAWFTLAVAALFFLAAGCSGTTSTQSETNSAAFDSVRLPSYSGDTEIVITHSVNDYKQWLEVYNKNSDPNARISIYTSSDDPNLVTIYEFTKSHKDAKNFFNSDGQQNTMQQAGVSSTPVVHYYDVKYRAENETNKIYRLGVSHVVEDYNRWKKGFDEHGPIRTEAGLELRWIATDADDSTLVHVIFATDDIDKAKDVITSVDLKQKMKEAGVVSGPEIVVLKIPNP
ncbi:hypothetical protein BH09BAC3_BH09BAC3_17260 [soil metagenome]